MGGMEIINQTYYLKIKMGIKRAFPGTKLKDINKNLRASILLNSKGEARRSGELTGAVPTFARVKLSYKYRLAQNVPSNKKGFQWPKISS